MSSVESFLEDVSFGLGLRKGYVVMRANGCVIKMIPSECVHSPVTSHQLHHSHQHFSRAIVMTFSLLSTPLLFCTLFSPRSF